MIKEDNKRIAITLSPYELGHLEDLCERTGYSKTELLLFTFKKHLATDFFDDNTNLRLLRIVHLLETRTQCHVIYITNDFVIYTVGLDDKYRVLMVDSCYLGLTDNCLDEELLDNITYEIMVS